MSCTPFILPQPKDHIIRLSDGERLAVSETHSRGVTAVKGYSELVYVPASDLEFADPAVYAKRLMEAAYRADTSPSPEWLVENTKYAKDVAEVIHNIFADCMTTCGCYERGDKVDKRKAIKAIAEALPFLARWQAQQEGAKHE